MSQLEFLSMVKEQRPVTYTSNDKQKETFLFLLYTKIHLSKSIEQ